MNEEIEPEKPAKRWRMSDVEFARHCANLPPFQRLAKLLGNDVKAAKAMREEIEFVKDRPELPRGEEFADKVRGWLVANKLEWTQENLGKAVVAAAGFEPTTSRL